MKKIYGLSIGYLKYYATNKGNIVKTLRAKERYCKKPTVFLSYSIYIYAGRHLHVFSKCSDSKRIYQQFY